MSSTCNESNKPAMAQLFLAQAACSTTLREDTFLGYNFNPACDSDFISHLGRGDIRKTGVRGVISDVYFF